MNPTNYIAKHGEPEQEYVLTLRLCGDGFASGYDRVAVEILMKSLAREGRVASFNDPKFVDEIMPIICRENDSLPWASWLEIDNRVVEAMVGDFFTHLSAKLNPSLDFKVSTMTARAVLDYCSMKGMWLNTTLSEQAEEISNAPIEFSEHILGSQPSDIQP